MNERFSFVKTEVNMGSGNVEWMDERIPKI